MVCFSRRRGTLARHGLGENRGGPSCDAKSVTVLQEAILAAEELAWDKKMSVYRPVNDDNQSLSGLEERLLNDP